MSLRRTFGWFGHAVALIVDPLIVWIGVGVILNGDWFGAVIGLFGAYLLAQEIAILVHRRWRAERLMAFFGLSFFFVLTAWVGIPSALNVARDGAEGIGIGIAGLLLSALALRYAVRILLGWRRAQHS